MKKQNELLTKMKTYLCPPGNGVFTVNTAKERKEGLHQKLFKTTENIETLWMNSLDGLAASDAPCLLGVCSDTGGGILRGANWGPLFLREQLLADNPNLNIFDMGDIRVIPHLLHDKYLNDPTIANCRKALYGDEKSDLPVSSLSITEDFTKNFYDTFPTKGIFAIGGDHSVSYPLVKSYLIAKKAQGKKVAVVHFDAHTDLLVERLGIDICFGSWATHVLEFLDTPALMHQIGIRSTGKSKEHWESTFGVHQHWAKDVKEKGAEQVANEIVEHYKKEGVQEIYISFDIDAIDSSYASATGTPEKDGLDPHEAMTILKLISSNFPITGADIVEIAPFLATNEGKQNEPDTTLSVASSLGQFLIEAMANANRSISAN